MKILKLFYINFYSFYLLSITISQIKSNLSFAYPSAITLINGNIFVVEKFGIYICDHTLSYIIKNEFTFSEEDQIKNEEDYSRVILKQRFSYIISLINYKIYIFDSEGKIIYNDSKKIAIEEIPKYYTLTPILDENNSYYYIIGYFQNNNLNINYYKYDKLQNKNENIYISHDFIYNNKVLHNQYQLKSQLLTCEYIQKNQSSQYVLVCFYIILKDNKNYLFQSFYSINSSSIEPIYNYKIDFFEIQNIKSLKSEINNEFNKIIIRLSALDNKDYQYQFVLYEKTGKIIGFNDKKLYLQSSDNILELNKRVKIKDKIKKSNYKRFTEEINEDEIIECQDLEKCSVCSRGSISQNLCIKCNTHIGYYNLKIEGLNRKYIECVNDLTKPQNFYFHKDNEDYEICYDTCATCNYKGDGNVNNCTSCEENFILKPDIENSTNCVPNYTFYYYYTNYNQYKCTEKPQCPEEYNLLIKDKSKCVDNCINNDLYKYQYNGQCLSDCPIETIKDNYLCKDANINKCQLTENEFMSPDVGFTEEEINIFSKTYAKEYQYTDNHVTVFKNKIYSLTIYKNVKCISELALQIPEIDFKNCYKKIKSNFNISDNLVIAILDKIIDDSHYHKMISYSIYHPKTGDKLIADEICKSDIIVIKDKLFNKLNDKNVDFNLILNLTSQGINIFDLSSRVYTDICYEYDSNIDKDIALKDRILIYYPNITLCEYNCEIKDVNITSFIINCECQFNNIGENILSVDNNKNKGKLDRFEEFIESTNIVIIKCLKYAFAFKYFKNCFGGFIILCLIFIQIGITIVYFIKSLYSIRKYVFSITNKYIMLISDQKAKNEALLNYTLSIIEENVIKKNGPPKRKDNDLESNNENNVAKIDINRNKNRGKTTMNKNLSIKMKELMKMNSNQSLNKIINKKIDKMETKSKKIDTKKNNISDEISENIDKNDILVLSSEGLSSQCSKNNNDITNINVSNSGETRRNIKHNNTIKYNNHSINTLLETRSKKRKKTKTKTTICKNKKIIFDEIPNFSNEPLNKKKTIDDKNIQKTLFANLKDDINVNIEEYLKTDIDDMEYEDAVKKEKREFCTYFGEKLRSNQIILNTFYYEEPLKPKSMKLLLFVLDIDLYFFVNGLFFSEEYISQIYHLEEDTFYDSFMRLIGNFFYSVLVGIIVNYIIGCLFIDEKEIKGILKREKDNLLILKYEIVQVVKDIRNRCMYFIILSFIITIFTWFHICCFNYVYPHMQGEWLTFSIIIIILMQVYSALVCLLESILRFLSFKMKSERIYKISLMLS